MISWQKWPFGVSSWCVVNTPQESLWQRKKKTLSLMDYQSAAHSCLFMVNCYERRLKKKKLNLMVQFGWKLWLLFLTLEPFRNRFDAFKKKNWYFSNFASVGGDFVFVAFKETSTSHSWESAGRQPISRASIFARRFFILFIFWQRFNVNSGSVLERSPKETLTGERR